MDKHDAEAHACGSRSRLAVRLSRADVEAAIGRLIDLLDGVNGDPDAEDVEADLEDEEDDDTTDEPSLGSLDQRLDQAGWGGGASDERERDESDLEPWLGAPDAQIDQRLAWADTPRDDREHDESEHEPDGDEAGDERDGPEDSGLGDADGAMEQLGARVLLPSAPDLRLTAADRVAVDKAATALDALVRRRQGVSAPAGGGNLRLLDAWLLSAPRAR